MTSNRKKHSTIFFISYTALFIAIIVIMTFTPIGYIKLPGLELTLMCIPVAVGAILLGPIEGLILGLSFGLSSFIQCFTGSAFGAALLSINPFLCAVTCILPRTIMGLLTGLIFKGLKKLTSFIKVDDGRNIHVVRTFHILIHAVANISAALLNTLLFMGTLCLCFYNTDYIQEMVSSLGANNVFMFCVLFVGIQGLIEACINLSVGTIITSSLERLVYKTLTVTSFSKKKIVQASPIKEKEEDLKSQKDPKTLLNNTENN